MNNITYAIEEINKLNPVFKGLMALNQSQTAAILGVSDSTMEGWRKKAIGPEYIKTGPGKGRILYPKQKIAEYLDNTIKTM